MRVIHIVVIGWPLDSKDESMDKNPSGHFP